MYVIVQHSGYGYGDNPQFKQGLEQRWVTPARARTLRELGAVVFNTYADADAYCDVEMYRTTLGLTPEAPGSFINRKVDGLRVYIPQDQPERDGALDHVDRR